MSAVLDKDEAGNLIRKAGILSIVIRGGIVQSGDLIGTELPPEPHNLGKSLGDQWGQKYQLACCLTGLGLTCDLWTTATIAVSLL
jgi:MOSC domain-containing protein YiiM